MIKDKKLALIAQLAEMFGDSELSVKNKDNVRTYTFTGKTPDPDYDNMTDDEVLLEFGRQVLDD